MTSHVYFVSDGAGAIKIGYSSDIQRRLAALGNGSARGVTLIGLVEGTRSQERDVHRHLAAHRMSGEWFQDCDDVRHLIDRVVAHGLVSCGFYRSESADDDLPSLAEAKNLADIITRCTGASVVDGPGEICGVPRQLLWRLRYRPGRDVYADELTALRSAALKATEIALHRAAEDRRWVIDICTNIEAIQQRNDRLDEMLRALEAEGSQ